MNILPEISKINKAKFSGITKLFRKDLYQNPAVLDSFYSATKESGLAIGSLPKDLIDLIKKLNLPNNGHKYKEFTGIISTIGDELQLFEAKKLETVEKLNAKNFIGTYLPKLAKVDIQPERIAKIIAEMRKKLTPEKTIIQEYNEIISDRMTFLMKEKNLIKQSDNIKLTYIGQGVFKNAFKMEILNKNGENLVHPKVLLSFKQQEFINKENEAIFNLLKDYMTTMSRGEFISKINGMITATPTKVIPTEQRELYKETLIKMYDSINSGGGIEKFSKLINSNNKYQTKYNGILPESNIIMFFKHAVGKPLAKTDFIDISYIDPKHNIGIAEYSDELLPKITKKIDLKKIGIFHDDLIMNKNNQVADRVVDYGNIKIMKSETARILSDSSIARRYYNKFQQIQFKDTEKTQAARIEYWNHLYEKAINHKIPNHNEVLEALQISKEHILNENHSKLLDFDLIQSSNLR